jgi:hypothetical protein
VWQKEEKIKRCPEECIKNLKSEVANLCDLDF